MLSCFGVLGGLILASHDIALILSEVSEYAGRAEGTVRVQLSILPSWHRRFSALHALLLLIEKPYLRSLDAFLDNIPKSTNV